MLKRQMRIPKLSKVWKNWN